MEHAYRLIVKKKRIARKKMGKNDSKIDLSLLSTHLVDWCMVHVKLAVAIAVAACDPLGFF